MKEPVVKFSLSCDDVIIAADKKNSLIGIFENIGSSSFPVKHPRFAVITRWGEGEGKFTLQIRLMEPSKKRVITESKPIEIAFRGEGHYHNDILYLQNTEFESPGTYWIESLLNGKAVHYEPLYLNLVQKV